MGITLHKHIFDELGRGFYPAELLPGDMVRCVRRPPHDDLILSVAELEEIKASGATRTYVRGGEMRIQINPPQEDGFIPSLTAKGRARARGYRGRVVGYFLLKNMQREILVPEADWLAWLAQDEGA